MCTNALFQSECRIFHAVVGMFAVYIEMLDNELRKSYEHVHMEIDKCGV